MSHHMQRDILLMEIAITCSGMITCSGDIYHTQSDSVLMETAITHKEDNDKCNGDSYHMQRR